MSPPSPWFPIISCHLSPSPRHHQVTVRRRHQHFPPLWRPTGIGALQAAPTSPEGHKAILRHRRDHHLCGMASHGSKSAVFWWRVPNVSDDLEFGWTWCAFLLLDFGVVVFALAVKKMWVRVPAPHTFAICGCSHDWKLQRAKLLKHWIGCGMAVWGPFLRFASADPGSIWTYMNSPFDVGTWVKYHGEKLGGWWLQATWNHLGLCFENLSETTHQLALFVPSVTWPKSCQGAD